MTRCRKCGSTILAGYLQACRCIGKGRPHSVSSFVRTHPRSQAQQTHGTLHRLWRRHWTGLGLLLVILGWGGFLGLYNTPSGYGSVALVFNPSFLAVALAVGLGLPICKSDVKRGNRVRGGLGTMLAFALGAATTLMLFTRILNIEPLLKL